MSKIRKTSSLALLLISLVTLDGCDPNKMADKFFSDLGLNRLAVLRTDLKPGAVILADTEKTMYASNIDKYVDSSAMPKSADNNDATSSFEAVLPSYSGKKGLDGNVALKFLDTVFPANLSGSLKLSGSVTLDQVDAQVKRMEPDDIETLLNSDKSGKLKQKLQDRWDGGSDVYIAYETYSAKSFKLKTTSNTDIAPDITVGKTKEVASGELKVKITHSDTRTLKIEGDKPYVFALRTAKVEPRGSSWQMRIMVPAPNLGVGTKAAADRWSALINMDSTFVDLRDRPNGLD
jgi:hypothetical protein